MNFTIPQDLYVGFHHFPGNYHLLPTGSSERHVYEYVFFIQTFYFGHSIIYILIYAFISIKTAFMLISDALHSFPFLYSFSFLHLISFLYSFSFLHSLIMSSFSCHMYLFSFVNSFHSLSITLLACFKAP